MIFDCDGVLVDSEPIANRVLAELLSEAGWPTTSEESMRRYTGRSLLGIIEEVEASLGRPIQRGTDFIEQYRERVFAEFHEGLEPIDGVAQALARLARLERPGPPEGLPARGLAICVASSSFSDRIELSLRLTGLLEHFEGRLFSAQEVERGKPQPDLFLHAARRMGAAPSQCVVVEDSIYGVMAGVSAGMQVLGFCPGGTGTDPEALEREGARVFASMRELPGLISEILVSGGRVGSPHSR